MLVHCYGSDHQKIFFSLTFRNVCITSLYSTARKPVCATTGNMYAFSPETHANHLVQSNWM